ncbi:MAG TPA: TetR/AcrR family transcriptional regulator [Chloroflexota bacterium]|nr:TetR/AcrR family transcriptional regulator [Chloroflexota bacterium]
MSVEHQPRLPSPAERRRRNREEMTGAILDAAREIMREQGVAALNLNEVARRVGVKAPSLYEYFPGKAALYDALFRLGSTLFAGRLEVIAQQDGDPFEQIGLAIEGYMTFAQEYPELWSLVFERPVPGFVPSAESMEISRAILERGRQMVGNFIAAGRIRTDLTPEQATDFIDAVMHGLTAAHLANQPELPAGSGRFGGLIPVAVQFFRAGWQPQTQQEVSDADGDDGVD